MDEKPKSIWKKTFTGRMALFIWLAVAVFTVMLGSFIISLLNYSRPVSDTLMGVGLLAGAFLAGCLILIYIVWPLLRWLFWKHWRRTLFGFACFVTLIALFYAEEDWRGKHAWEKFKREWEAKGEKFDFASFVPSPVPDDQNFALTPIVFTCYGQMLTRDGQEVPSNKRATNFVNRLRMEIVYNYEESPKDGDWMTVKISDLKAWRNYYRALAATTNEFPVAPQPQSPAADVLLALSKYDPAIEELRQASQLPDSRFPLDYDTEDPAGILLPHLGVLKQCSLALQLRAIAELQNGQSEQAFDDVKLALRLADSVRTEPFIITHLLRIAILKIALQPVWEGLAEHQWSDTQLAALDAELAKLDFLADYEFSARSERAAHVKVVDWMEQKRSRFWQLFNMVTDDEQNMMNHFCLSLEIYLMPKGWYYQSEIVLSQVQQQRVLPIVNDPQQTISPQAARESVDAVRSLRPTGVNLFARLLLPELGKYAERAAYGQNAANLARVAIALERYRLAHGNYPESLDLLSPQFIAKLPHDIINGEPLHYRRTDDPSSQSSDAASGQFVLYSVGWNEVDDGGKVGLTKNGNVDIGTGDWVWRCPAR
jgi:hypothetical protein